MRRGLQLHICLNCAVGVFLIRVFGSSGIKHQHSSATLRFIRRACRQKQPLTLQNPGGKGVCEGGNRQLPTETLSSALLLVVTGDGAGAEQRCAPLTRPRSPPTRRRRPADRDRAVRREGGGRPSCHMIEPPVNARLLQRRLTFSGFRRPQVQVVPRPAVHVEVRGRDPPLLLRRADEPPTCGEKQSG